MKRCFIAPVFLSLLIASFSLDFAWAESTPQSFTLKPGWNAVFLEVEPQATAPVDVFAGITDLQSVWMWNSLASAVESIQNPDTVVPGNPQWFVYFPDDPDKTTLFAIHGEMPCLIHLGGTTDVTWTVTGEPRVPRIDWKANSFNFVGFHLSDGNEPTFHDFFSASASHADQDIYLLDNATTTWVKVTDPNRQMKQGEAFWIYCKGHSEFVGPLSVQLEQGKGLHYGTTLVEEDLRVLNNAAQEKTVSLKVSSEAVKLHYWLFDPENKLAEWVEFPTDPPLDIKIAAGERQELRLGVRRAGLTPGTPYEANVELKDDKGMRILLPVSVTGIDFTGLWVGNATINKVSQASALDDPETPGNEKHALEKTGSEFSFRLILHVNNSGEARLLSEVVQLWQEGGPGHFVLVANDEKIGDYSGAALRDGQPVGRRISSPVFGFSGPQLFSPVNGFGLGNTLSLNLLLSQEDPTNPFRHLYHPDHKLPEQSYGVTRKITLEFSDTDSDGNLITGVPILSWGSTDVGGIYKEEISGLHREDVYIEGTFLLRKVSSVQDLTY